VLLGDRDYGLFIVDVTSLLDASGNPLPTVSITATDATASEPGLDQGAFTVSRTGPMTGDLTVNLRIAGTASNGVDYAALNNSVTIPAGASSVVLTVAPLDDCEIEEPETVAVSIVTNVNYLILTRAATPFVTIFDDEITDGAALRFDGVDDYVNVPDSASLRITNTITVEAWIKRATIGVQHSIVEKYGCSGQGGYLLRVRTDDRLMFGTRDDCNTGGSVVGNTPLRANLWYHVAGTWDGGLLRLYVNACRTGSSRAGAIQARRHAAAHRRSRQRRAHALRRRDRRGARVECRADGGRNSREREPVPGRRRTGSGRLLAL